MDTRVISRSIRFNCKYDNLLNHIDHIRKCCRHGRKLTFFGEQKRGEEKKSQAKFSCRVMKNVSLKKIINLTKFICHELLFANAHNMRTQSRENLIYFFAGNHKRRRIPQKYTLHEEKWLTKSLHH